MGTWVTQRGSKRTQSAPISTRIAAAQQRYFHSWLAFFWMTVTETRLKVLQVNGTRSPGSTKPFGRRGLPKGWMLQGHAQEAPVLTDPARLPTADSHGSPHPVSVHPRHPHKPRSMASDDCHPSAAREQATDTLMPLDTNLKLPREPMIVPAGVSSQEGQAATPSGEDRASQTRLSFNIKHNAGRKADPRLFLNSGDFRTNTPIHVQNPFCTYLQSTSLLKVKGCVF